MSLRMSRRQFTLGAGASLLAAPFVQLLTSPARAAESSAGAAKRLIIFFTPNGTVHSHWRPTGGEFDFAFAPGSILESLTPFKKDLIVLDGIDFYGTANHEPGMAAMLTGNGGASSLSKGLSVDQYIAAHLEGTTKFKSLELGVATSAWGASNQTRMSYSGPGIYVPPDDSPVSVYERMFGEANATQTEKDKLLLRRQSVLDLARGELKTLRKRVGTEERPKLDQHLAAIEEVEAGLKGPVGGCAAPETVLDLDTQKHENFAEITKAQLDLLVLALSCGMTRVASIQLSHTVGPHVFSWLGLTEGHHTLSHAGDEDVQGVAKFVKAERWFTDQFAYLLEKLSSTPEPDADGSMLDHSCVVWAQELGDGRMHDCLSVPFVLAGGAGGAFTTGRYLNFQSVPHQKLLVSICHAMGLSNPTFGDPSHGGGPLSGLAG